jgi:multicomponent Na+:H+ antiporter subunit C
VNAPTFYGVVAAVIFGLAAYGLLAARHLVRKVLAMNVMGSSVFLALVAMSARGGGPDPVPHAMVLTGIVVTVAITGVALALVRRHHADTGTTTLPEDDGEDRDG